MKINKNWLVGFVDGEGTFFVGVNKQTKMTVGHQILPEFVITQHKRDIQLLYAIRKFLNCGVVREQKNKDICSFRVRKLEHLLNIVIPFFHENELLTVKKFDFYDFRRVVRLMEKGRHCDPEGFGRIIEIKNRMNRGRILDEDIVPSLLKDKE